MLNNTHNIASCVRQYQTDLWTKHIWETTLVSYKAALNDWHKGTGGGSGLETEFEKWDDDKFQKYNIEHDDYDHTNIASRPLVLFNLYSKSKEPYLTVIRLWDNAVENLLCAKYDPIYIGIGEVGMNNDSHSDYSSCTSPTKQKKRKGEATENAIELGDVLKSIHQLCDSNKSNPVVANIQEKKRKGIEYMSLEDLYQAVEQYKRQLEFLKEMDMLDETEKIEMVQKTKLIFLEINKRTSAENNVI